VTTLCESLVRTADCTVFHQGCIRLPANIMCDALRPCSLLSCMHLASKRCVTGNTALQVLVAIYFFVAVVLGCLLGITPQSFGHAFHNILLLLSFQRRCLLQSTSLLL
jgi:hypothetical protein